MVGNDNNVSNYYNVTNGKIVKSYGKTEPDGIATTPRVNKNGETVYEQNYDYISGKISNCRVDSHDEYGDSIKLTLTDSEDVELSIKFDSSYGRSFLFKLNNIDVSNDVKITPYSFTNKEGKGVTGLNVHQNGVKLLSEHTRETPNGLPQLKQVMFNGKNQWDKTEQITFLKEKLNGFISKLVPVEFTEVDAASEENTSIDDKDELPF